jgi:hypothetical protein
LCTDYFGEPKGALLCTDYFREPKGARIAH